MENSGEEIFLKSIPVTDIQIIPIAKRDKAIAQLIDNYKVEFLESDCGSQFPIINESKEAFQ